MSNISPFTTRWSRWMREPYDIRTECHKNNSQPNLSNNVSSSLFTFDPFVSDADSKFYSKKQYCVRNVNIAYMHIYAKHFPYFH